MQGKPKKHYGDRGAIVAQSRTVPNRERLPGIATTSLIVLLVAACSKSPQVRGGPADSLNRDLELAPVAANRPLNDQPKAAPAPRSRESGTTRSAGKQAQSGAHHAGPTPSPATTEAPAAPAGVTERMLPSGTAIQATLEDSINSRRNKVGEAVVARVSQDITDQAGHVVIPAGSRVELSISELAPAKGKGAADGKLAFQPTTVMVNSKTYALSAQVQPVAHELRGRGVSAGEAEKVGAGTAIGAVLGRIIGGNGKGAVIGGVVGAAGGTAVAVETASRDVVVRPGTPVNLTLTGPLVVEAR